MFVNTADGKLTMPLGNKMGYTVGANKLALYTAGLVTAKRVNKIRKSAKVRKLETMSY